MTKEIMIGETAVTLRASAATPIRYKALFGSDLIKDLNSINDSGENIDSISQIAYVMALQGVGSDFTVASIDTFFSWLDQFEATAIINAGAEIMDIYNKGAQTTSVSKKKNVRRSAN